MSALFNMVVSMSLVASVVILIVMIVRVVLKNKMTKTFSYLLWGIVLIKLIIPISFESSFSVFNIIPVPESIEWNKASGIEGNVLLGGDISSGEVGNKEVQSLNTDSVKDNGEIKNTSINGVSNPGNIGSTEADQLKGDKDVDTSTAENIANANDKAEQREIDKAILNAENLNNETNHTTNAITSPTKKLNGLVKIISYIWFTVTVALSLVFVTLYFNIKLSLRDKVLYKTLDKGHRVYQSDKVNSPILLGLLKPVIVIPKALDLSEQQLNHIIDHELMHMKRFDNYVKTLTLLVVCIHWFNPLVWVSYFIAMKDMELSCDEQVLQSLNKVEQGYYADTLLQISIQHNNILATGLLAFGEQNVKSRIKAVLGFKKVSKKIKIVSGMVIVLLFVVLISQANSNRNMDGEEIDGVNEQDYQEKTGDNNLDTADGENTGDANNSQENNAQLEKGYKSVKNKVIGKGTVSLPGIEKYTVTLQMYKGNYHYDEAPGAFQGDNWEGKCKLILSKEDKILSEYILDDWDDENMTFQSEFEILFADYDEDGVVEFLIGQYLTSNVNEYRVYQITKWDKIVKPSGVDYVYITGAKRYSCVIPTDQEGNHYYKYYNNSESEYVKMNLLFVNGKIKKVIVDDENIVDNKDLFFEKLEQASTSLEALIEFYDKEVWPHLQKGSAYGETVGDEILNYYFEMDQEEFLREIEKLSSECADMLASDIVMALGSRYQYERITEEAYKELIVAFIELTTDPNNVNNQFIYNVMANLDKEIKYDLGERIEVKEAYQRNQLRFSPNQKICFYITGEQDVPRQLYLYNNQKKVFEKVIETKENGEDTPKVARWLDNDTIILISGYGYGRVSLGGSVYMYNVNAQTRKSVFEPSELQEYTDINVLGESIILELKQFKTDQYNEYDIMYETHERNQFTGGRTKSVLVKDDGSINYEYIVHDMYVGNVFSRLIYKNVDYEAKISFHPFVPGKGMKIDDKQKQYKVGYTIGNQYYDGLVEAKWVDDHILWRYVESDLIIDDTQPIIDKAIQGHKADLYKIFGEDLKETEVVYVNFAGKTSEDGYSVSLNIKFRLEGEHKGYGVGSIGPLPEEGWYGGDVFASIGKTDDGYVYYGTSTSP